MAACGGPGRQPTAPTNPTGPATPTPSSAITGVVRNAVSDDPLGGVTVHIDGVGDATTGQDGTFRIAAADPRQLRAIRLTAAVVVDRATQVWVPGPDAVLPLMPSAIDLTAFNEMFRGNAGALWRWTTAPPVIVQTKVLQFTSVGAAEYTALAGAMSDADAYGLLADLRWGLPQLTGTTFQSFASEQTETAAEGDHVPVMRTGTIVVARYEGLTAATGYWGYSRWATNGAGVVQGGIVMIDRGFDTSGSPFTRALRVHELGHALGYNHVTVRASVMNASARVEPNAFDRDGARIAFQRPPLNRSPDQDPATFSGNVAPGGLLVWTRGQP